MFGLLNKKISCAAAVEGFIAHVAKISDRNFKIWVQDVLQAAAVVNSHPDKLVDLINAKDTKIIYFAAVAALESLAIRNCFPPQVADQLYDDLRKQLSHSFEGRSKLPSLVFLLVERMRTDMSEQKYLPMQSAALFLMTVLDFDEHEETSTLFESPIFIMAMSSHFVERGCMVGWWKSLSTSKTVVL
jgi:hypothetical protein